jgi:uncharacterized membrane protein
MLAWTVWNLFLASLPVALARPLARRIAAGRCLAGERAFGTVWLAAAWLLLLPNAPYLLTEIRHFVLDDGWRALTAEAHRDPAALRASAAWGGLFLLYGAVGLVCLTAALRPVERALRTRGARVGALRAVLFPLVALGVWLGLIPRFNSWDALVRPFDVLGAAVWAVTHVPTLACVLGFAAVLAGLHALLDVVAAAWDGRRGGAPHAGSVPVPR